MYYSIMANPFHDRGILEDPRLPEGVSFIRGAWIDWQPHEAICWAHSRGKAVRQGHWKLTSANKGRWELYDLDQDGTELNDLADKMPEKVKELAKLHATWSKRTDLGKKKK